MCLRCAARARLELPRLRQEVLVHEWRVHKHINRSYDGVAELHDRRPGDAQPRDELAELQVFDPGRTLYVHQLPLRLLPKPQRSCRTPDWGTNAADGHYMHPQNSSWETQWLAGGNGDGSLT